MTTTERILSARKALETLTPLRGDCGRKCGAACCHPDEDGNGGMLLFPSEEALYDPCPGWARLTPSKDFPGQYLFTCDGTCERAMRPLACRIFPLTPVKAASGRWTVRMDARARAMCPLVRSGVKGLDPDFARGVVRAMRIIAETPEGEAFLERWAALEQEYRFEL